MNLNLSHRLLFFTLLLICTIFRINADQKHVTLTLLEDTLSDDSSHEGQAFDTGATLGNNGSIAVRLKALSSTPFGKTHKDPLVFNIVPITNGYEFNLTGRAESETEETTKIYSGFRLIQLESDNDHSYRCQWFDTSSGGYNKAPDAPIITFEKPIKLWTDERNRETRSSTSQRNSNSGIDMGAVIQLLMSDIHKDIEVDQGHYHGGIVAKNPATISEDGRSIYSKTSFIPTSLLEATKKSTRVFIPDKGKSPNIQRSLNLIVDTNHPEVIRSMPFLLKTDPVFLQIIQTESNILLFELHRFSQPTLGASAIQTENILAQTTLSCDAIGEDTGQDFPELSDPKTSLESLLKNIDLLGILNQLSREQTQSSLTATTQLVHPKPLSDSLIKTEKGNQLVSNSSSTLHNSFHLNPIKNRKVLYRFQDRQDINLPVTTAHPQGLNSIGPITFSDGQNYYLDYQIINNNEYRVSIYDAGSDTSLADHQLDTIAKAVPARSSLHIALDNGELTASLSQPGKKTQKQKVDVEWEKGTSHLIDPSPDQWPDWNEAVIAVMTAENILAHSLTESYDLASAPLNKLITDRKTLDANRPLFSGLGPVTPQYSNSPRDVHLPHKRGALNRRIRGLGSTLWNPYFRLATSAALGTAAFVGSPLAPLATPATLYLLATSLAAPPVYQVAKKYPKTALALTGASVVTGTFIVINNPQASYEFMALVAANFEKYFVDKGLDIQAGGLWVYNKASSAIVNSSGATGTASNELVHQAANATTTGGVATASANTTTVVIESTASTSQIVSTTVKSLANTIKDLPSTTVSSVVDSTPMPPPPLIPPPPAWNPAGYK